MSSPLLLIVYRFAINFSFCVSCPVSDKTNIHPQTSRRPPAMATALSNMFLIASCHSQESFQSGADTHKVKQAFSTGLQWAEFPGQPGLLPGLWGFQGNFLAVEFHTLTVARARCVYRPYQELLRKHEKGGFTPSRFLLRHQTYKRHFCLIHLYFPVILWNVKSIRAYCYQAYIHIPVSN